MPAYMDEARGFHRHALGELREWRLTDDPILLRDAAEKTWGAVTMASNALLESRGREIPDGTNSRMNEIVRLENRDRHLRAFRLSSRFDLAKRILHQDCFYEGDCPIELITDWIEREARVYLEDVASAMSARRR